MHTSKYRNSIEAGSLPIESKDHRFVTSSAALVEINDNQCEYEINELLSVILNDMQDLNAFP